MLWSGLAASGVTVVAYVSCQRVLCSDHKPVVALLRFQPPEADSPSPVEGLAAGGAEGGRSERAGAAITAFEGAESGSSASGARGRVEFARAR